jgi:hypothetical protein
VDWQAQLTQGGDYQIDVVANQETDFKLDINVR